MIYNEVIIVEGKNDASTIKKIFPNVEVIITNGMEIANETIEMIVALSKDREIILLLDPDGPGEKIRKRIMAYIPNAKHVFINRKDAISKNKKKVGIEHVSHDLLKDALINALSPSHKENQIKMEDLYSLELVGLPDSFKKRQKVCEILKIGSPNAKTFLARLNMFNISLDQLKKIKWE